MMGGREVRRSRAFLILIVLFCLSGTRPLPQAVLTISSAQIQNMSVTERASQDRDILYELHTRESHALLTTHDLTARALAEKYYFNVVRAGTHVTDADSAELDTGGKL